jgi:hypothetical protein
VLVSALCQVVCWYGNVSLIKTAFFSSSSCVIPTLTA